MRYSTAALSVALAAASLIGAPAYADTIVYVDGLANASIDGSNAVTVTLPPGSYVFTFTSGTNTAFSRFGTNSSCDANGLNCVQGYETLAVIKFNGQTIILGAGGGYGPIDPGNGYYATPEKALANAGTFSATIQLAQTTSVGLFLHDDHVPDNRGGLNIRIDGGVTAETTTYRYDAKGRLSGTSVSGGVRNGVTSTYNYDAADNRRSVTVAGAPN